MPMKPTGLQAQLYTEVLRYRPSNSFSAEGVMTGRLRPVGTAEPVGISDLCCSL